MNNLTAAKVRSIKAPGSYLDGQGLRLKVTKAGSKSWIYRFQLNGKSREMGLGAYPGTSLKEAREGAADARKLTRVGTDPITHRKLHQRARVDADVWTFDKCTAAYIKSHAPGWSTTHTRQWRKSLARYASPVVGDLPVAEIDTDLVMAVIEPQWYQKPETLSRVRSRIEIILSWATAKKYRTGPNPAAWRGHIEQFLPRKKKLAPVVHLAAMPYEDIQPLVAKIQDQTDAATLMTLFVMLTCVRVGEAASATWEEVDLDKRIWTIPVDRMKTGSEQRIPLSTQAVEILEQLEGQSPWIFPSTYRGKHVTAQAPLRVIRKHEKTFTMHGFRSSFSQWRAECTDYARELGELSLAHAVGNEVERSYQRSDLLEKRRPLMEDWADYITTTGAEA